jgi:hypothetical protein
MEMVPMPRIAASIAVAALLAVQAAPLAFAQMQMQAPPFQIQPQTQGNITYVSGGIADDWQRLMESQRGQYNLHLIFAQTGTGAFFANLPVQITDARGQTVLNAVSQGPMFWARMPPGTYRVSATESGRTITKTAYVPARGAANLDFRWSGGNS